MNMITSTAMTTFTINYSSSDSFEVQDEIENQTLKCTMGKAFETWAAL